MKRRITRGLVTVIAIILWLAGQVQAPASRKSWSPRAAGVNIVTEIQDRRLSSVSLIRRIVWIPVTVKVSCGYQCPAAGKDGPPSGANKG